MVVGRIAVVVIACASAARADELIDRGDELARRGEFSRAIELFKESDAKTPTAGTACRIGLVYTRRELWSQAEIFFAQCKRRATAADPVPDWLDAAEEQLAKKLAAADAAPIDIRVDPGGAMIHVSTFPADERFPASTIHLAPGTYLITAAAPGRVQATATLKVVAKVPQIMYLSLSIPPPPPHVATRREIVGTRLLELSPAIVAVGITFHAFANIQRDALQTAHDAHDPVSWDRHAGAFEADRAAAIGFYALAATAMTLGIVLRRHRAEIAIHGAASPSGAAVSLEVRR
jgi:hypothetical protein